MFSRRAPAPAGDRVLATTSARNRNLADAVRILPVTLAAEGSAMIGGVVATNAGGLNVLRYGMTRGLVLGLEVVLPDGTVVDGLRALRKDNAGYDWKQLFIGSEGTLGIITAAILRLVARPRHTATALLAVEDPAAALRILHGAHDALGDTIQAFELISRTSMDLVAAHAGLQSPLKGAAWSVLIASRMIARTTSRRGSTTCSW